MAENTERLRAADLITAIKSAGIRFIIALPDRTTSEHLLKPMPPGSVRSYLCNIPVCWIPSMHCVALLWKAKTLSA